MTDWQILMLNLESNAAIIAAAAKCGYCGKPVLQTKGAKPKKHCDAVCMRRAQAIKKKMPK